VLGVVIDTIVIQFDPFIHSVLLFTVMEALLSLMWADPGEYSDPFWVLDTCRYLPWCLVAGASGLGIPSAVVAGLEVLGLPSSVVCFVLVVLLLDTLLLLRWRCVFWLLLHYWYTMLLIPLLIVCYDYLLLMIIVLLWWYWWLLLIIWWWVLNFHCCCCCCYLVLLPFCSLLHWCIWYSLLCWCCFDLLHYIDSNYCADVDVHFTSDVYVLLVPVILLLLFIEWLLWSDKYCNVTDGGWCWYLAWTTPLQSATVTFHLLFYFPVEVLLHVLLTYIDYIWRWYLIALAFPLCLLCIYVIVDWWCCVVLCVICLLLVHVVTIWHSVVVVVDIHCCIIVTCCCWHWWGICCWCH